MRTVKTIKKSSFIGWHYDVHTFKGDMAGSVDASGRFRACWRDL